MDQDYNLHLLNYIESNNSTLLRASEFSSSSNAVFQLNSGACQESFLTIWELFKNKDEYNLCIAKLAELLKEINKKKHFNCIVTSTITAKHLCDRLHSFIEEKGQDVDLYYLGHNPFITTEENNIYQFESKNVIIITDVIASGGLVKSIAESVSRLGGKVVSAVGVFLTGQDIIAVKEISYKKNTTNTEVTFNVYGLCEKPIPILSTEATIDKELISIDPETIFPIPNPKSNLPMKYRPIYDLADFIGHTESSESLNFGFNQKDNFKFTTAVNINRFIEKCSDEIWHKIKKFVKKGVVIATTFDSDDLLFREFIEARTENEIRYVHIPEKESYNINQRYFIFKNDIKLIVNNDILLVVTSLHSFNTLGEITALLALHGASKITVMCLFNRMGVNTLSFLTRIEQLLKGFEDQSSVYSVFHEIKELKNSAIETEELRRDSGNVKKIFELLDNSFNNQTFFEFIPIYSIADISSFEIYRMEDLIRRLLNYFKRVAKNESYQVWIEIEKKYLEFHKITNSRFASNMPGILEKEIVLVVNKKNITCTTKDGLLATIINDIAWNRSYENLINYIDVLSEKTLLYKVFGILISDINFIVNKNYLSAIRDKLIELIRISRLIRRDLNDDKVSDATTMNSKIDEQIQIEINYIFGLSLFSYFDKNYNYEDFILEIIDFDLTISETLIDKMNVVKQFSSDRLTLVLSMLLHFSQERFHFDTNCVQLKKQLLRNCETVTKQLKRWEENANKEMRLAIQESIQNLDNFEREFSSKHQSRKIDIISFLNHKIIVKENHHPIRNTLDNIIHHINSRIEEIENDSGELDSYYLYPTSLRNFHPETLIEINKDLKTVLEQGIKAVGTLIEISNSMKLLVKLSTVNEDIWRTFNDIDNSHGFEQFVNRTVAIVQSVRKNNKITGTEFNQLKKCRDFIVGQFFEPDSEMLQVIENYDVDICSVLDSSFSSANKILKQKDLSNNSNWEGGNFDVWTSGMREDSKKRLKSLNVVFEELELKEILVNALTNIRYSFNKRGIVKSEVRERVTIETFHLDMLDSSNSICKINIVVKDGVILTNPKANSTFSKQANIVKEYGGSMKLYKDENTNSIITEIHLTVLKK